MGEKVRIEVIKTIDTCLDCPFCGERKHYDIDAGDSIWYCKKAERWIMDEDDDTENSKIPIPDWCPLKREEETYCERCHRRIVCWKMREVRKFLDFLTSAEVDGETLSEIKRKLYKVISAACSHYLPTEEIRRMAKNSFAGG